MTKANHPVAVYCMNPRFDYPNDYRLRFLRDLGVPVDDLYRQADHRRGWLHGVLKSAMRRSFARQLEFGINYQGFSFIKRLPGYLASQVGILFYKLLRLGFYDIRWARSFLQTSGARAVLFDHVMPGLYVVESLLRAAREMSIPSFALPHGVHLYTNEATKPKSTDARRTAKFNEFDFIIVPNRLRKEILVKSGVSEGKIFVLGSARYCHEWIVQNKKIMPRKISPTDRHSNRLKVVFLPSKPQCQVDLTRLRTTCDILAGLQHIDIRVKPHTRAGGEKHLFDGTGLVDASHLLTAELCEWADVALVVGSSVITETLMLNKPALYLKYLHANTTLFEELGACWTIHNENELINALKSLQKNKATLPYEEAGVLDYIREVVNGGKVDSRVLENYGNFIVTHARQ
jgi:hypothetical protein